MLLFSQHYKMDKGHFVEKINFELINNLMVLPIEVNRTKLFFILDSEVGMSILFNLAD